MSHYLIPLVVAMLPLAAGAASAELLTKYTEVGANLGVVLGSADHCGVPGQRLADAFPRGLEHFGLSPGEIQSILVSMDQRRQAVRQQTADYLNGQACPTEFVEKIKTSVDELEVGWYASVKNRTGVDMRAAETVRPVAPPASAPATPPASSSAARSSATVPPGKYSCYTFDAGQLNYSYTDVVIHDASRYAVGNKQGTYRLEEGGAMRFTGSLSNATGRFSIKNTGKAQIDLVFNGDPRSSMACSQSK